MNHIEDLMFGLWVCWSALTGAGLYVISHFVIKYW